MIVPVKNIVEQVDLTSEDVLLPMLECVVNSIISLKQSSTPKNNRKIQIQIERGEYPQASVFQSLKTISTFRIIDNGVGFNERNYKSFETPFSQINKEHGCKGIGRFTALAAYKEYVVNSNYLENNKWTFRSFKFTTDKEIEAIEFRNSEEQEYKTVTELKTCINSNVLEKSALSIQEISEAIMKHCLIYYLSDSLPRIEIIDTEDNKGEVVNDLFEKMSKDKERTFIIKKYGFRIYITKIIKEGNRKNNYLYYCANSRTVGEGRNLKNINSIFSYPVSENGNYSFLDIYIVSEYLDTKVFRTRNGFNIPKEKENLLFNSGDIISFQEIEEEVSEILENEYSDFIKEAKERSVHFVANYIKLKAPRFNSFLRKPEILNAIPPNLSEDKLEEHLYKISFSARKNVEQNIEKFIKNKTINEDAIIKIKDDLKTKTAFDVDSLADYMMRRKAILELFEKFLDADEKGEYKLEEDVHNLIFPLGLSQETVDYENHNLWLLDERFITYKYVNSDSVISSFSQINSRREPDLILYDNPQMFDNPISFGDKSSGELNSMVIFEFKRPGDIAHQKRKTDFRWEFSELVEPYFDEFLYQPNKKNHKGNHVVIHNTTPKFGFVIMDVIPNQLAEYNVHSKGWKKTPFGSYFKMEPGINLHIEVMTFRKLIDFSKTRHNPFFDKLFV